MSFPIIAITNRGLCIEPLPLRVAKLCAAGVDRVIVREKDLSECDYIALVQDILHELSPDQRDRIVVNTFVVAAQKLGIPNVQLPLPELNEHSDFSHEFHEVGISVHGVSEALLAQKRGANYLIAGHVFPTDCKADLAPRGLEFLREVCDAVVLPVYAIGGIDENTIAQVRDAGATGACLMSSLMLCADPAERLQRLRNALQ